jgi:hypothetical protein
MFSKMMPFQYLYGYEPLKWKELATGEIKALSIKDQLEEEGKVVQLLKENLTIARNYMEKQVDQHRIER